jgi:thioredoxin 1
MTRTSRFLILGVAAVAVGGGIALKEHGRGSSPGANRTLQTAGVPLPRLLDLGSDTCIPCKKLAPILAELAQTHGDCFQVEVIDVRKNRAAAQAYGIRLIPTQIFYDAQGQERYRHEGFISREEILRKWRELGVDVDAPPAREER